MATIKKPKTKRSSAPIQMPTMPEIHHHYYPIKPNRFNFGKLSFGLFLLIIGILYLAKNLGWIDITFSVEIWQLWPLLIVFAGLSMLTGRNIASIFAGIVLTITVLTITLIIILGPSNYSVNLVTNSTSSQPTETIANGQTFPISVEADKDIKNDEISIKSNLSKITIAGGSDKLLSGQLISDFSTPLLSTQSSNGRQTVSLDVQPNISLFKAQLSQLNLTVNNQLASSLYFESLASTLDLSLAGLESKMITIDSSASNINLDLNGALSQTIELKAKVSEIAITLPTDKAVKIILKNKQDVVSDKLEKINNLTYQTPNYNTATDKIVINLDLTVSDLTIK